VNRLFFALLLTVGLPFTDAAAQVARDQPPAYVEAARQEAELKALIAAEGLTIERALKLASLQETRGLTVDAEATLRDARKLFPNDRELVMALSRLLVRHGKSAAAMEVLEELARLQPEDRQVHYMIGTHYEEIVRKNEALPLEERRAYLVKGIAAIDRALALDPAYSEALAYKNILLRHQARLETDPVAQRRLIDEADLLRTRAMEMMKARQAAGAGYQPGPPAPGTPPPPPPPATPPCDRSEFLAAGRAPVRVGGNVRAPAKVTDVRPVYPVEAQSAKIQGVVIIEAVIGEDGRVAQGCVLRSIPLLDVAALDAVKQWEFTPTLLNGAPVPVIMTVTVNFTLQ
jgi:TonB family protein